MYLEIGVLPSLAGADQVTVKPPSAGTTVTFCGAPGTANVIAAVALCGDTAKATNRSDDAKSETNFEFVFMSQILLFASDLIW
jgi:cytochrome c-type biogenesis protein CcmH/NrfF